MSYNLYLDDFRKPEDSFAYTHNQLYLLNWTIIRDYDEFVYCIKEYGLPEMISFDHDLADVHYDNQGEIIDEDYYDIVQEKTGYHCAKWLINYCIDNKKELPQTILVHSMNVVGSHNIKSLFRSYKKSLDLPSSTGIS